MIREKFIDRLRQKYQYAGFKGGSTVTPSIEESIKPSIRPISNISQTQDMPEREKALSFLSKGLKYAAPFIKGGQSRLGQLASKSLGPISLMLGANKAYGGNVYDPVTGEHKYTGETFGTPFQSGGLRSAYETPAPDSNIVGQSRKSLAEIRRLDRDKNRYLQTGGMYDQMQQYQMGGQQLPGGEMNPIPGSDAVEFTGASHDEGGIMLDPQTEVEDGETMDQVTVAKHGGKRGDYFFSSYLKKGGRSFADMHKDILRNGGDQQEIDWLARMQEKAAGRDAKKVGKAKLGGMMKYQSGGEAAGPAYVYTTSDATRDYNQYLKDMQFNPSDPDYDATGILNFEDWSEQQGLVHQGPTETRDFAAEDEAAAQFEYDLDLYDKALKRDVPLGAYVAGATQLAPAAYSLLHKQPEAEQVEFTPGFTHPIVAERGKASKLQRVNYNVERARNAADMRAINKYIETSGGGPANIINKMMAYSKKQEGDTKIAAAETRANTAIANQEAQMAQQMELNNLQRAQQAATTNAQLAAQEATRADQVEELNARRRQQRIDDMEYMKYQGIGATAQGIAGFIGDALSYKAQEKLAKVMGAEGVYDRSKAIDIFLNEINPATGALYTREQAADKVRDIYNYLNPKEDKDES